jgi:hypothetical protein
MTTRSFSALLTAALGCLLLVSSCAKPSTSTTNCTTGQTDCGGQCKSVQTDNQNCGACGTVCGGGKTCQTGMCKCAAGLFECGGSCVQSDATHCGGCNACPNGQVCAKQHVHASCPSTR